MVNGERHWPSEQPYSDFGEEFSAFRELVKKFNPDINFQVTEASVNACEIQKGASGPFSGTYGVSEQAQAKFLIRLYLYNQMLDLGPTFWWDAGAVHPPDSVGIDRRAWPEEACVVRAAEFFKCFRYFAQTIEKSRKNRFRRRECS